ncbi:MAG TPA: hypothetical protein VFI89_04615, partial [Burkholderiales bacterium]|nr:hypothetical protein [Burkholderiales bacterium]
GAPENRASGVLRVAEEESRGVRINRVQVEHPAAVLEYERNLGEAPRRELYGALEVVIDRSRNKGVAIARNQLTRREVQARDDSGNKYDPPRVYGPAVQALHAFRDGEAQLVRRRAVSEDAVLDARRQRFADRGRGAKISVGNPERDNVAAGVALPACAPGTRALDGRVEIERYFLPPDSSSFSREPGSCSSS